jgi:hypothetical protein
LTEKAGVTIGVFCYWTTESESLDMKETFEIKVNAISQANGQRSHALSLIPKASKSLCSI